MLHTRQCLKYLERTIESSGVVAGLDLSSGLSGVSQPFHEVLQL